jgi:hypothetical protein
MERDQAEPKSIGRIWRRAEGRKEVLINRSINRGSSAWAQSQRDSEGRLYDEKD